MTRTVVPIWLDSNLLLSELRKIDAASRGESLGGCGAALLGRSDKNLRPLQDHYKLVVQKTSLYYKICGAAAGPLSG